MMGALLLKLKKSAAVLKCAKKEKKKEKKKVKLRLAKIKQREKVSPRRSDVQILYASEKAKTSIK